jgi:hypothetical protein
VTAKLLSNGPMDLYLSSIGAVVWGSGRQSEVGPQSFLVATPSTSPDAPPSF